MSRNKKLKKSVVMLLISLLMVTGIAFRDIKGSPEAYCEKAQTASATQKQVESKQAQEKAQKKRIENYKETNRSNRRNEIAGDMPSITSPLDIKYQRYLYEKCNGNMIKYYTILAIIQVESNGNPNTTSATRSDGSHDMGLVQMNSKYLNYERKRFNQNFDPYNPNDAIDYICDRYDNEYQYWTDRNIVTNITNCICGSYNMGRVGYHRYIKSHGFHYSYNNRVLSIMENLMKQNRQTIQ